MDLDFQYREIKVEKTNARLEDIYAPFLTKKEMNLLIKLAKLPANAKNLVPEFCQVISTQRAT